jgi:hypothetical protein
MKRAQDRKKLRRQYLYSKLTGYCHITASTAGLLFAVAGVVLFGGLAALVLSCIHDAPTDLGIILILLMTVGALACGGLGLYQYRAAQLARDRIARLSYVPPVTPNTLPAEEILVRGCEQPAAQSDSLLRATQNVPETPSQELLRIANEAGP